MSVDTLLFGRSALRREILRAFFTRPRLERHVRELARELHRTPQAVGRELEALERAGVLTSTRIGRARRYRVDETSPIAREFRTLVQRTIGVEAALRQALADLDGVEDAFIFGSYARADERATSDVDVLVIGGVDWRTLSERMVQVEGVLGREVNALVYTRAEFDRLRAKRDAFIADVAEGPKIELIRQHKPV